jgi:DNA-binding CsgD family transcriptional regulator
LAAGWAIVHGRYLATHSAFTWLSGRGLDPQALPTELARAVAGSLAADRATVWARRDGRFHAIGTWPDDGWTVEPQADLHQSEAAAPIQRPITAAGTTTGSISVTRPDPWLSRHEVELLDGYCAQAALVIEHLRLATTAAGGSVSGGLDHLTPREREVLGLMARGLSNAAICEELHLSKKTVEPAIGSIFAKLGLTADGDSNRRVLAVLAYVQDQHPS